MWTCSEVLRALNKHFTQEWPANHFFSFFFHISKFLLMELLFQRAQYNWILPMHFNAMTQWNDIKKLSAVFCFGSLLSSILKIISFFSPFLIPLSIGFTFRLQSHIKLHISLVFIFSFCRIEEEWKKKKRKLYKRNKYINNGTIKGEIQFHFTPTTMDFLCCIHMEQRWHIIQNLMKRRCSIIIIITCEFLVCLLLSRKFKLALEKNRISYFVCLFFCLSFFFYLSLWEYKKFECITFNHF